MEIRKTVAAFVGFGEVNTPREFINKRCQAAAEELRLKNLELIVTDTVADDPAGKQASRAVEQLMGAKDFDVLIICIAGWIPSWAVFKVVEKFRHKPMVLWGLSGWQAEGRFVTTADQAGTTALRKPMADMGYNFKYVVNLRGCASSIDEVVSYANAAKAAALLRVAKIGMMGYRDMRLFGTLYDGVSLKAKIGPEIEHFEMLEIVRMMEKLNAEDIKKLAARVSAEWDFAKQPRPGTVENAVKLYLALKEKILDRNYDAFSFVDVDGVKKLLGFAPAGSMTLMHQEMENLCTVPENDSMGAVTQLICRYLTGQVSAYLEFYEFMADGALMGVPDYVPPQIVEGKVKVMPTAFGDFGEGLLNVSKIKTGTVTIGRLGYQGDKYCMHIMNADAVAPRPWEEAGWAPPAPQLPSLEIKFAGDVNSFIQNVMAQHYIITYGNNRAALENLCAILEIEVI